MKTCLTFLFILPFGLFAQDWKVISVGNNSNYYIRKHSENPGDTKVWIKEEGPKIEYTNSAGKKVFIKGKHIFLWDIKCDDKQIALISTTVYNSSGAVLNNTVIPSYSIEFQDVIPESKGEQWLDEACHLFNPEEEVEEEMEEELIEVDTLEAMDIIENIDPQNEDETLEEEAEEIIQEEKIYTAVQQQAEFPGGLSAWSRFLMTTLKYPSAAARANKGGRVFVSFVVNTDGSIQDVKLIKGVGFGCDEEAIRVIKSMPRWNPAKQNGKPVRSIFNQPITFVAQ